MVRMGAKDGAGVSPDPAGFGRSRIPSGFEWSLPSLATFVARVLDKAGVESAHIIGAKTGGAIAMQFAADYPGRTRTLAVASGPASVINIASRSKVPQLDRLGSAASKEMVEYWNDMFAAAPQEAAKGLNTALSKFDLARDGVLQRITAPTLVITADRSVLQSVEKVRQYQLSIPKSRLVVLHSDAYHIAAANADECVTNVLAFIRETRQRGRFSHRAPPGQDDAGGGSLPGVVEHEPKVRTRSASRSARSPTASGNDPSSRPGRPPSVRAMYCFPFTE
jgi:3-oxoadipate enol-lactonase